MTYKKGMVVRHKHAPEWGSGEIIAVNGKTVIVRFFDVGIKVLDSRVAPLELVQDMRSRTHNSGPDTIDTKVRADIDYFAKPKKIMSLKKLNKNLPRFSSGVYGWYFKKIPPYVPAKGCPPKVGRFKKWKLLYIGSGSDLKNRILGMHFTGNADSSSLRLSLGCVLIKKLKIYLWKLRTKKEGEYRYTFADKGEDRLSKWMAKYARVAWRESERYKELEKIAVREYKPPLNTDDNPEPFIPLRDLKREIKACAQLRGSKPPKKAVHKAYKRFVNRCKDFKKAIGQ